MRYNDFAYLGEICLMSCRDACDILGIFLMYWKDFLDTVSWGDFIYLGETFWISWVDLIYIS